MGDDLSMDDVLDEHDRDIAVEDVIGDEYSDLRDEDQPENAIPEETMPDPDDPYGDRDRQNLRRVEDHVDESSFKDQMENSDCDVEEYRDRVEALCEEAGMDPSSHMVNRIRAEGDSVADYDPRGDKLPSKTMWLILNADEITDGRKRLILWVIIPECKSGGYTKRETWEIVQWFCEKTDRHRFSQDAFDYRWDDEDSDDGGLTISQFTDTYPDISIPSFDEDVYDRLLIRYQKKWEIKDRVTDS